jgi:CDP-6-deoxy-D-xylo-4-hexulose-3-dehydrase
MTLRNTNIKLIEDTIDKNDIDLLIKWLETYPRLTKGELTIEFENLFAKWIGCKYSVFVNSGSSANLLMLYTLIVLNKLKNKKIVVPTLSWVTDLAPVIQFGLTPILVDCNLENLSVDINHLEEVFKRESPSCLILVSVLGFSPDMKSILNLCEKYDVILIEDNCESQGSKYNGTKLGNFGLMSSFSTYFGHTMSTIEGGIITTNDEELYKTLIQLRSHGWSRDLDTNTRIELNEKWGVDSFSSLYTFFVPGFNLRSTDLQAFIGINQLNKIDGLIDKRNENLTKFKKYLNNNIWFPKETSDSFTSLFCFPIIMDNPKNKSKLIESLNENNIECRPLISGSMGTQPFFIERYGEQKLQNASIVDSCGLYLPSHPNLTDDEIKLMSDLILASNK